MTTVAKEKLLGIVATATEQTRAAAKKKAQKRNATGYAKLFEEEFNAFYDGVKFIPWSIEQSGAFKRGLTRTVDLELHEQFISFLVTKWHGLMASKNFSWMQNAPEYPEVFFILKSENFAKLYRAFEDFLNPNRKAMAAVDRAEAEPVAQPKKMSRLKKRRKTIELEAENAALKKQVRNLRIESSEKKRKRIESWKRTGSKGTGEFGKWED